MSNIRNIVSTPASGGQQTATPAALAAALPFAVRPKSAVSPENAIRVASYRAQQHMESWLPVSLVAKDLCVSPRRIRALLDAERIVGRRLENGYWEVKYPYNITVGRRGPIPFAAKRKKQEQMKEWQT